MVMHLQVIARRFEQRWLRPWLRYGRDLCGLGRNTQRELGDRLERRLDEIERVLRELVGLQHLAAADEPLGCHSVCPTATVSAARSGSSADPGRWAGSSPPARCSPTR